MNRKEVIEKLKCVLLASAIRKAIAPKLLFQEPDACPRCGVMKFKSQMFCSQRCLNIDKFDKLDGGIMSRDPILKNIKTYG